ncbi:hypothetical protein Y032_0237g3251 [Ancylostoma ceylanicum]|uniref:Uncharacterized protein n=1 Tax=Ancylostoma ceylanicum TaxID=53326 RepID=A0A016SFB8_9BILA|nr:hypothetical protein Y032_0237g3251 [Ancylostoma ceylanicum]
MRSTAIHVFTRKFAAGNWYRECQSRLPLLRPQHPRWADEATPNIHSARPRRVDVAAAGMAIVTDIPCTNPVTKNGSRDHFGTFQIHCRNQRIEEVWIAVIARITTETKRTSFSAVIQVFSLG